MRGDREPAYGNDSAEQTDPIFIELGMDLRVYLRLDVRKFLRLTGIDPQSGEPTPDQLQAIMIEGLRGFLRGTPFVVAADVNWIDEVTA